MKSFLILSNVQQSKIDEEREIYEQERDSTDERFRALEEKIKGKNNCLTAVFKSFTSLIFIC